MCMNNLLDESNPWSLECESTPTITPPSHTISLQDSQNQHAYRRIQAPRASGARLMCCIASELY